MEENLILEGLLSMVTELKEKQEAQVTPAGREETLSRLEAIERALSELRRTPAIPEKELQAISDKLSEIRKSGQEQRQSFGEVKRYVVATFGCLKDMLEMLQRCHEERTSGGEETKPVPLYQQIYNKAASLVRPRSFLFSAGLIVCATSLFLNVRLTERMGQLQDNDMKYRYLLMQGQADGSTLERLENKFKWQRDERFIRILTDSVLDFEERCRKQAEALERARLLNEQAEQLKREADRLGNP